uniref:Uncharacterized protein LOC101507452 n=1 Tax=Cicer arietinum TaxID=3827 RepID=A0A1S3EDY8_CICAR|nr:uncharacterized protein LOC101507452 [Cicer arietinum]
MVLHMVTLMKLHLQLAKPAAAGFSTSVVLLLKLLIGFRFFRDEALYQSRLFLFRLGQIAFNTEPQTSNVARMGRALRLIFPTNTTVTASNSTSSQSDRDLENEQEEMFYALSMLAL